MKLASIERINRVEKHPNADSLDIVTVLNYKCITPKGKYCLNDLVVFIQPDTVLPDAEWSAFYKSKSNRVKAIQLRGEWSFGIVESLDILPDKFFYDVGLDVSQALNITKYEYPFANEDSGVIGQMPYFIAKTDEERYQNIENLSSFFGKKVDITHKIDGKSFIVYYNEGKFGICARSIELDPEIENAFTEKINRYNLKEKLEKYCQKYNVNLALQGELHGKGIQNHKINPHAKMTTTHVSFFKVWNISKMRHEYKDMVYYVKNVCEDLDLPLIPYLDKNVTLTKELIEYYDSGIQQINLQPFEGAVIIGEDFSFKVINKYYDSKK